MADSDFVFEMHEKTMRHYVDLVWGWSQERQRASHDRSHPVPGTHIVAMSGNVVGVVQHEERDGAFWIGRLEIDPGWQGQGLGAEVVERLGARAAERALPVRLRVLEVNDGARRFYERLRFRPFNVVAPHVYMQRD